MPPASHFDLSLSEPPYFGVFGFPFDPSSVSDDRKLLSEQDNTSSSISYRRIGRTAPFILVTLAVLILDHVGAQNVPIFQRFIRKGLEQLETALQPTKNDQRQFDLARALALTGVTDARSFTSLVSETIDLIWRFWFLLFFGLFLDKLSYPNDTIIIISWTFGQIVAITVWAGPIFRTREAFDS